MRCIFAFFSVVIGGGRNLALTGWGCSAQKVHIEDHNPVFVTFLRVEEQNRGARNTNTLYKILIFWFDSMVGQTTDKDLLGHGGVFDQKWLKTKLFSVTPVYGSPAACSGPPHLLSP